MMIAVWLAVFAVMLGIEFATAQLTTIWFAAGAAAALIACIFKPEAYILQVVLFLAVSVVALIATRPLVRKLTKTKHEHTNADSAIGKEAIVTERISNLEGTGAVTIGGIVWTARTDSGETIPAESTVVVDKIDGVKLIVHAK